MEWSRTRRQCHSSNFDVSHPVSRVSVALSSERCSCRNKHCQPSRRERRMMPVMSGQSRSPEPPIGGLGGAQPAAPSPLVVGSGASVGEVPPAPVQAAGVTTRLVAAPFLVESRRPSTHTRNPAGFPKGKT
jgi:hypothetical protein